MRGRSVLGLLVVMLMYSVPTFAFRYHIHTYGESDGLTNQTVFGIDQGPDGRIWLATRKGLVVYDGANWTNAMPDDSKTGSGFRDVVVDEGGRIWIADLITPPRISWFEEGVWHHLPSPPVTSWGWDVAEFDAAVAPDGRVWVAIATSDRQLLVWNGDDWAVHDRESRIGGVFAIRHQGGDFLLGSKRGLWILPMTRGAEPRLYPGRETRPCYGLAIAGDGGLWVVENGSVVQLDPDGREEAYDLPPLRMEHSVYPVSAVVGPSGGLYLGSPWQVTYFHPDSGHEILDRDSGLASEGATDFLVDREENVWVGSSRGLSKIVSLELGTLDRRHGLMDDEVTSVFRLRDGRMLLGHEKGMTILEDPPRQVSLNTIPRLRSRFMDLAEADDGTLWAAMDRHGLARITPDGDVTLYDAMEDPNGAVYSVLIDGDDAIWIGGRSRSGGLNRLVDGELEPVMLPAPKLGLPPFVRRLSEAPDGGIFVMTGRHGVFHLRRGVVTSWGRAEAPGALSTYCSLVRPDGEVWIGTSVGVHRLGDGILEPVTEMAPLNDRPVYAIQGDRAGRIWMGTDEGLRIWDGEVLKSVRVGDGLAGSEINRDGMWLDNDGSMWVGTDRGVTRFEADYLVVPRAKPIIDFLGFDVDGARAPVEQTLRSRGPIAILVAHFRGISFVDEGQIRYRTWLEGFEEDWQPLTAAPQRQLRYTNIPPGDYRFHVQAVGMHGEESSIAVSAPVVVVPPVWRTWWFMTGVALLCAAAIGTVTALVFGRRSARRLRRLVRERTARLNDLERSARSESERMGTTLQSISDGVLAVDGNGELVLANRAAAAMLGEDTEQLLGQDLHDLLPTLSRVETAAGAPIVVRQGLQTNRDVVLEATVAPLGTGLQGSTGKVIALRDVTDRHRFEEEMAREQRLESLGLLAGGIAHDFNNLLTVILGHTSLLEAADLAPADSDAVSRIRLSSDKARKLTQQLLTFARGGEPRRELTPLPQLIEDTTALAMSGANTRCRCDLENGLWPAMIDADQVGQALSNLLINSCQAMPDGGEITITGRNLPVAPERLQPGRYVELAVSDQGVGLPLEEKERIFEPFFTTKAEGNGLGLAVAYSVARRHGGGLTAKASPSGGAIFTLVLPAASEGRSKTMKRGDAMQPLSKYVLVMDDDPAVCEAMIMMLESLGCEAVGVPEGSQALTAWKEAQDSGRPFDLAILDLTVPGAMGGRETIRELHQLQSDLPALVASGYSNDEVLGDPTSFGFAGAIVKPFDTAALADAIQAVLGG